MNCLNFDVLNLVLKNRFKDVARKMVYRLKDKWYVLHVVYITILIKIKNTEAVRYFLSLIFGF